MRTALLLTVLAACSVSRFDDLRDQAWSDSNSAPDGVDSERFPTQIAALATGRPGVHVAVAGADPAALATISYDGEGSLDAKGIALEGVATGVHPVLATVIDPEAASPGRVAVGGLGAGTIRIFDARTGADGPVLVDTIDASACGGTGLDLGRTMIWIRTDLGEPGAPDLIAVAGRELIAFPDLGQGNASPPCVRCTQAMEIGGVGAGHLTSDVRAQLFVALRDPAGVANAQIAYFAATAIEIDDRGTCFSGGSPSVLPGRSPGDGDVVVVGDLDDDGLEEAVVSRDDGSLDIHPDVTMAGSSGAPFELIADAASTSFGTSYAIGDLDGDGRAELVVGDPGAVPDGANTAGSAFVFRVEQASFVESAAIFDLGQDSGRAFGHTVAIAPFAGTAVTTDLLTIGTDERLYVYFRALAAGSDPRP